MEKQSADYALLGLKALERAARKALERARRNKLRVPIWQEDKIEYITPEETDTEQTGAVDRQSAALLGGN